MRPSHVFNHPLVWAALVALIACIWLPDPSLRLAAVVMVMVGLGSHWRRCSQDQEHAGLMQQALMLSEEGVQITDADYRIQAVNPAFTRITGYTEDEVRGLNAANLAAARHDTAFFKRFWQTLQNKGRWEGEIWNRRKQGDEFPEWLRIKAVTNHRGRITHYVGTFTDISVHKAREQDLRRIGFEDPLTGLPNRRRLHDLMTSRLRHLRAGESLDMAIIDIDGFKAVNDSLGVEHGDRLLTRFAQRLARHDIQPALLGLELTESVLLDERAGDIVPRLKALQAKGHRIAIDDFGMGYSSLSYLKHLPLDKLKLDRAFIHSLPGDAADAAIVAAVLAMARGLGLGVVAEGVETQDQLDFLQQAGCELVQGFLYARPAPAAAIEARWQAMASAQTPPLVPVPSTS